MGQHHLIPTILSFLFHHLVMSLLAVDQVPAGIAIGGRVPADIAIGGQVLTFVFPVNRVVLVTDQANAIVHTSESSGFMSRVNRVISRWRQHLPLRVRFCNVPPQILSDGSLGPGPSELTGVLFDVQFSGVGSFFGCVATKNPFHLSKMSEEYMASADDLELIPTADRRYGNTCHLCAHYLPTS